MKLSKKLPFYPNPAPLAIVALLIFLSIGGWSVSWPSAAITHGILAVGIFPLILGSMIYFIPVLTRSKMAPWSIIRLPFLATVVGSTAWLAIFLDTSLIVVAAPLAMILTGIILVWMHVRSSKALGSPHPGLYWYQAALVCLLLGLISIVAMLWIPEYGLPLRTLHRYFNSVGFVGMTAIGTLQVLLPTVGGYPDPKVSQRLHFDLKYAMSGSLLMAFGAAFWPLLGWFGLLLWGWVLIGILKALSGHFQIVWQRSGAAISLTGALLGFLLVLMSGLIRQENFSLPLFFCLFLFPLVTGALSHLLPLWWWPGEQISQREWAQHVLGRGGMLRMGAFWLGGWAMWWQYSWGVYPIIIVLIVFLGQIVWALYRY